MTDRAVYVVIAGLTAGVVAVVGALMLWGGGRTTTVDVAALPLVNACLNGVSASLLVAGWRFITQRRYAAHVACMAGAFVVSALFLVSYVTYHYHAGSRTFTGQGWIRPVYFATLISHIVLAAAIVPLALTTIYQGLRALRAVDGLSRSTPRGAWSRRSRHARIARWTLPIWLYVSVTGVIVYWLLHRW
jgi:putative membrane protein